MLSLQELLHRWGFADHPFADYTAEREARLAEYFVAPPYFDDVLGTAAKPGSFVAFGDRGIGKSAIRVVIQQYSVDPQRRERLGGTVVTVSYDDFTRILRTGLNSVTLDGHIDRILHLLVAGTLLFLHATGKGQELVARLSSDQQANLAAYVRRFYLNLPDVERELSARSVFTALNIKGLQAEEALNWFQKVWAQLRVPLLDLANVINAVRGKPPITPQLFEKENKKPGESSSPLEMLERFVALVRPLGVGAFYVLVDKIDETDKTDKDATKAAALVLPLLTNLKLFEIPGIGFKFFLWERMRPIFVEEGVRFDKIRNERIVWTEQELRQMLSERLKVFSVGNVKSLRDLCTDELKPGVENQVLEYAKGSPREIVQLCDTIFREHGRNAEAGEYQITKRTLSLGIDKYCTKRVADLHNPKLVVDLQRLATGEFTNAEVQRVFKVGPAGATNKVQAWVDNGLVEQVDRVTSEKDPPKKVNLYRVVEPRVRRIIEHKLEVV